MKKIMTLLLAAAAAGTLIAADAVPLTKNFQYQGKNYKVGMTPAGAFTRCDFGKEVVFNSAAVQGSYEKKEKYDDRMNQYPAKNVKATVQDLGGNKFRVISSGTLFNAKFPDAADYVQTAEFLPGRFTVSYKITQKIPMASKLTIFRSITNIPLSSIIDKGCTILGSDKKESVFSIPATCERNKGAMKGGITELKLSLDAGIFTMSAGALSTMTAMDCRSWGEKNFRIDAATRAFWKNVAEVYPAGKIWTWSVMYQFTPHAD